MKDKEFEITFIDETLLEANGRFKELQKIITSEFPYPQEWNIISKIVLKSAIGVCEMVLDFNQNKNIHIMEYASSNNDVNSNMDLTALTRWAQSVGWNVPIPHPDLIRKNLKFWMHWWKTGIIDSYYLEDLYGEREHINREEVEEND